MIDTDTLSQHSAGTESKRGYALELPNYSSVYQAPRGPTVVSLGLRGSIFSPKDWPADAPIPPQRSAPPEQLDFPLLPTLRGPPITSHASDSSPPHFGYNASSGAHYLISERHPQTVAMSTLTGHAQYGSGGVIDAHMCRYGPSFGFGHNNPMVGYPRALPSPIIAMPIVPTYLDVGASSYVDPIFSSDLTSRRSPHYASPAYQHAPPPDSTPGLSPSGNFDFESYSSPRPTLSTGNRSPVSLPPEVSDQIQPQPTTTTSVDQRYTFTVSLQDVEFPPTFNAEEESFFQCCWEGCRIWITSSKEAVRNHLGRTHSVVFKGKSTELACCEWDGCSSSTQTSGLVRHVRTHLELKWLCSVCKGVYRRTDTVGHHARREPRCRPVQAISIPSPMAYKARKNGDGTVTLTKIVQP